MECYQVVLDTNVMVTAARSKRGASYRLLRTLKTKKWMLNVSSALILEYEAKLKEEAVRQNRPMEQVDRFLDLVVAISNRWRIYFLLRPFSPDLKDDFIMELAIASRSKYIVTYNVKDFRRAGEYGIDVMQPSEFLKLIEHQL